MRSALITGASDGIGLEVAKLLSRDYEITLVARNPEKLEKAKASLSNSGHHCVVADLSKKAEVDSLKSLMEKTPYDVFINNAGVGMYPFTIAKGLTFHNHQASRKTVIPYR